LEWRRAKTILIIALLLTNCVLIGLFIQQKKNEEAMINRKIEFSNEVKDILMQNDIEVLCEIPINELLMKVVTVTYEGYNGEKIAERIFPEYIVSQTENGPIYEAKDAVLSVSNGKQISYERYGLSDKKLDDLEMAKKYADEFIDKMGLESGDSRLTYHSINNDGIKLIYSKVYKDIVLEKCVMEFEIDNLGVRKFYRYWLMPLGEVEGTRNIRSASKALLNLLGNEDAVGNNVIEIVPAFYFNPNLLSESGVEKTKKAQAILSWRIQLDNGKVFFVEEY